MNWAGLRLAHHGRAVPRRHHVALVDHAGAALQPGRCGSPQGSLRPSWSLASLVVEDIFTVVLIALLSRHRPDWRRRARQALTLIGKLALFVVVGPCARPPGDPALHRLGSGAGPQRNPAGDHAGRLLRREPAGGERRLQRRPRRFISGAIVGSRMLPRVEKLHRPLRDMFSAPSSSRSAC